MELYYIRCHAKLHMLNIGQHSAAITCESCLISVECRPVCTFTLLILLTADCCGYIMAACSLYIGMPNVVYCVVIFHVDKSHIGDALKEVHAYVNRSTGDAIVVTRHRQDGIVVTSYVSETH